MKRRSIVPAALALLLAGCAAVGPDYRPPTPQELHVPAQWNSQRADSRSPMDLSAWWRQLMDPVLSNLIERALADNPDVRLAQARLREARARRNLAAANRFPTVIGSVSGSRTRSSSEVGSGTAHSLYNAGFDASWEPDIFGGVRRAIEAAEADVAASESDFHATQVSLAAEMALNYVELRSFQARIAIALANLATQAETLQITKWRAQAGLTSSLDVEQARTNLEQTRAQVPVLENALAEAAHRIAILLGTAPGAREALRGAPASVPAVPEKIAAGIPADTLRQRPDLRAAERRLAAETARVGQQTAALYPALSLSGSIGLEALAIGALTGGSAATQQVIVSLATTVFDAGRIRQQIEIQSAVQEQALHNYQAAVLTALEDVENALVALATSEQRRSALDSAVASARNAADLARHRYAAGITDFQTVLDTERTVLSAEDSLKSTEAQQTSALIQLYKALGGGWSNSAPVAGPQSSNR